MTTLRSSLIEAADTSSRARARELTVAATRGLLTDTIANIAEEGVAQVVADDGDVLAASRTSKEEARLSDVVPTRGEPVRLILRDAPDEDETEDYRVWAVRGDGVTAYVGTSLEDEREVIFELTRSLVIGLPLLVALFAAGTWLMVGRTLRPVEDIRAEVSSISHRRLDRRVPTPSIQRRDRPAGPDDERDARPPGGRVEPPTRLRRQRVARAAESAGVVPHPAGGGGGPSGWRRLAAPGHEPAGGRQPDGGPGAGPAVPRPRGRRDPRPRRRSISTTWCSRK